MKKKALLKKVTGVALALATLVSSFGFAPTTTNAASINGNGVYLNESSAATITVTSKSDDTITSGNTASLAGTVNKTGTMSLVVNGTTVQTATVGSDKKFSFTFNVADGRNDVDLLFKESGASQATRKTFNFVVLKSWDITVDGSYSGSNGTKVNGIPTYKTVQAAVNSVSSTNSSQKVIFVKKGDYKERVTVAAPNVKIIGQDRDSTRIYYSAAKADGTATGMSDRNAMYIGKTATGFRLENIEIENSFKYTNGSDQQADAIAFYVDDAICVNVRMTAFQDTLLAHTGNSSKIARQYFYKCYITGNVDFIYGSGSSVFDDCDIVGRYTSYKDSGCYTAAKTSADMDYGFVFLNCRFLMEDGIKSESYRLSRPWGPDASVTFLNCYMCDAVQTLPYADMSGNSYKEARFGEYNSYGPGQATHSDRPVLSSSEAKTFYNMVKGTLGYIASEGLTLGSLEGSSSGGSSSEQTTAATQATTAAQQTTTSSSGGGVVSGDAVVHNFAKDGTTSSLFTISGNTSTSKGSVTYNGVTSSTCLKMESATSISFTAPSDGTLTLVFGGTTAAAGKSVKVDGSSKTIGSDQTVTVDVSAGNHTITKGDAIFLFFMVYTPEGGSSQEHSHSYTASVTTQPTCTTAGVKTYTCSCGSSYTESIAATGHSYTASVTKEATCGEAGVKTYTCSCGDSYTEAIPATGAHSYTATVTKAAICTEAGVKTYTCSCGDSYTEAIAATGHSYSSEWTIDVEATTTTEGSKSHHCTVCDAKTDVTVIPKVEVEEVKNGLINENGTFYYYVDGAVAADYTGLVYSGSIWWYVEKGVLNTGYTGTFTNSGGTWYIINGQLDVNYTGIRYDGTDFWYVVTGKVNTAFVGLYNYADAWWYVKDGKIQADYKGMIDYSGYTWYVAAGKVDITFTGLGLHNGVWYCVQAGKVNMNYSGLVSNGGSWWYVQNGILDTTMTGIVETGGSQWLVATGKLQSTYTGSYTYNGNIYSIVNGKVQ